MVDAWSRGKMFVCYVTQRVKAGRLVSASIEWVFPRGHAVLKFWKEAKSTYLLYICMP